VLPGTLARAAGGNDIGSLAISDAELSRRLARYAPATLSPDLSRLHEKDRAMVTKLIAAAQEIDHVYWDQVSPDGLDTWKRLTAMGTERATRLARFMGINYGPWDRFNEDEPFYRQGLKPPGANFYPPDLSAMAFERQLKASAQLDREGAKTSLVDELKSPYTLVRREGDRLKAEPYSRVYYEPLLKAANLLKEAAALSRCRSMTKFLERRAVDLLTNKYYQSEIQWMNTGECPVELVIGPYETYEDGLLGRKTAFEAIIAVKDAVATEKVAAWGPLVDGVASSLPLKREIRDNLRPGTVTRITIADVAYTAGDARARFQVQAYRLPNDERVVARKGSKNVVLRNVVQAKYEHIHASIAKRLLCDKQATTLAWGAFLDLAMMWNLAQSIVVPIIRLPGGEELDMRSRLKERANVLDLVRADALGLVVAWQLAEKGALSQARAEQIACAYLATVFSNLRYGGTHAMAKVIVYNYLFAEGAIHYEPSKGRFRVIPEKLWDGARILAAELLRIEALGDYDAAGQLIIRHGIRPPEITRALGQLGDVPFDITPDYGVSTK
jgi:hypothetical protein